ncbi:MAG: DHA2 family efflux MFS transporter permease subunit [Pseudomonadota bacterium]
MSQEAKSGAWIGFIAMCLGMFMAILDIQVVASSLTNIQTALHISADGLSWIQTAYLTAEVIAIPLTGWLSRALSLRWMFTAATAGFTLASIACALSGSAETLIALRIVQGFCGGMLIPAVFTSVFTLLPEKDRVLATTIAGAFAVIAPTIGPCIGGYLTQTYSWHWIFLINVMPGILVCILVARFVAPEKADWSELKRIDYLGILLTSVFLGALEILLKEAPKQHWRGLEVYALGATSLLALALAIWRCLVAKRPFVHLRRFGRLTFSLGCTLNFILGAGIYGSVYALALFLGLVRGHSPLEIGIIMLVSGVAQFIVAPFAAVLETKVWPKLLVFVGFATFGIGLFINGDATPSSDYAYLFWPQALRGAAVMLCLLPATRLALEGWSHDDTAEASALFNLVRNLGGAIGIAVIDTILQQRTPEHVDAIAAKLMHGDEATAQLVGIPLDMFRAMAGQPLDPSARALLQPMVERVALSEAFNDAWRAISAMFLVALLIAPFLGNTAPARTRTAAH